jgi:hypothetical protein
MNFRAFFLPALLMFPVLLPVTSHAATPAPEPTFESSSESFELTGRIQGPQMTLILDRWASNEPVTDAKIDIEVDGRTIVASAQADGSYTLDASGFAKPAIYPLTISITAGNESDLLVAELKVEAPAETTLSSMAGSRIATIALLVGLLVLAAAVILKRHRQTGETT